MLLPQQFCPIKIIFFKIHLFIYLFMAALGLCCCTRAFSSCIDRGLLFVAVRRLLIAVASLVAEHRLQARGLQQLWLAGSRAQAQQLWRTGLGTPRHVGSSRTRARTRVPCIGRQILNRHEGSPSPIKINFKNYQKVLMNQETLSNLTYCQHILNENLDHNIISDISKMKGRKTIIMEQIYNNLLVPYPFTIYYPNITGSSTKGQTYQP